MSSFFNHFLELFTKQPRKITKSLLILLIFTFIFSDEATKIKSILISKLLILLPSSLIQHFDNLDFSTKDILYIWSFLLFIYIITITINIIQGVTSPNPPVYLNIGGDALFEINSIFLILVIINNMISKNIITISQKHLSHPYFLMFFIILALFVFVFTLTFLFNPFIIRDKLKDTNLHDTWQCILFFFSLIITSLISIVIISSIYS